MNFATLFDRNYIPRAELMIESLIQSLGSDFSKIFVLSLDQEVIGFFNGNPQVECIPLSALEDFFPQLETAKSNRSMVEYIFTLSPFFPLYLLLKFPEMERITSLDSDLYFFSSPKEVLNALGNDKIGITTHNFPKDLVHLEKFGKFNVSFQSFPNSDLGLQCLRDWADDCIQFCGDYLDDQGRFADQKYLDSWQEKYGLVVAFPSPEVGLAPWNVHAQEMDFKAPDLLIDGQKVVFYHFQGLRIKSPNRFMLGLTNYQENTKPPVGALNMYNYYINKLQKKSKGTKDQIKRLQNTSSSGLQSIVDDLRVQPTFIKFSIFYSYLDFRKVVDFAENRLKITLWKK